MAKKIKIAAFDFDNTIINTNCDTYIDKLLLPDQGPIDYETHFDFNYPYPDHINQLTYSHGWTRRMNAVFEYLFGEHKVTRDSILSCIGEVRIDRTMIDFLRLLKGKDYEMIIISDANSIFIDEILKGNGIDGIFSKVYTNPAFFDMDGCLTIRPYNELVNADGSPFDCETKCCTRNLCKGFVLDRHLQNHMESGVEVENIVYCGDGRNDFCAGLSLREFDHFLVRKDLSLAKLLTKKSEYLSRLKPSVLYWQNGNEILESYAKKF
jgi:pyridoxal phosphate phosphatase PHOSPHO2